MYVNIINSLLGTAEMQSFIWYISRIHRILNLLISPEGLSNTSGFHVETVGCSLTAKNLLPQKPVYNICISQYLKLMYKTKKKRV